MLVLMSTKCHAMDQFMEIADDMEYEEQLNQIRKKITASKKDDLSEFQNDIIKEIELNLAKRIFYQEGKAFIGLRNDAEVEAAIEILQDPVQYAQILGE